jgi:ankyrin repeat protein
MTARSDDSTIPKPRRRRFVLPALAPTTSDEALEPDGPRAVLRDHGVCEDIDRPRAHQSFEDACRFGNPEVVRAYAALGIDLERRDWISGETPLIHATLGDRPECIAALAAAGADLQGRDNHGATALLTAVQHDHPAALRALLEAGADPDVPGHFENRALVEAIRDDHHELVEILLASGASSSAGAATKHSALQWCVDRAEPETMRALLAQPGVDVDQATNTGDTLLHIAVVERNEDAVAALLDAGADPSKANAWGWTARDVAVAVAGAEIIERLERAGAPLTKADAIAYFDGIARNEVEAVAAILDGAPAGIDVETRNYRGHTGLLFAVSRDRLEVAERLRARGADLNARDANDDNALTHAISAKLRRWLVESGIELSYRDRQGALRQPGITAVLADDDHELLALLLDTRADALDLSDLSACHSALVWGDFKNRAESRAQILRMLGAAGADLEAHDRFWRSSLLLGIITRGVEAPVMALLELGVDFDDVNTLHATALHTSCGEYSAHEAQARITQALLTRGADFTKLDRLGRSAWDVATGVGNDRCIAALEQAFEQTLRDALREYGLPEHGGPDQLHAGVFEALARRSNRETFRHWVRKGAHAIVRGLLEAGFDCNPPQYDALGLRPNDLPLTCATANDDLEMVELLLCGGADPDLMLLYGGTALLFAVGGTPQVEIVRLLVSAGADPQLCDDSGVSPLRVAAFNDNLELIELLHEAGASVPPDALIGVGVFEVAQWLLTHGAKLDARAEDRTTALHVAIDRRCREVALALIAAGADPNVETSDDRRATPLMLATEKRDAELIDALRAAGATR